MKTADEMFEELGYSLIRVVDGTYVYRNRDDDVIIINKEFVNFTDVEQDYEFATSAEQFIPIAQKLKEMEENNG